MKPIVSVSKSTPTEPLHRPKPNKPSLTTPPYPPKMADVSKSAMHHVDKRGSYVKTIVPSVNVIAKHRPEPTVTKHTALKPCPFCGTASALLEDGMPSMGYWVKCGATHCKATGPRIDSPSRAAEYWNKAKR